MSLAHTSPCHSTVNAKTKPVTAPVGASSLHVGHAGESRRSATKPAEIAATAKPDHVAASAHSGKDAISTIWFGTMEVAT